MTRSVLFKIIFLVLIYNVYTDPYRKMWNQRMQTLNCIGKPSNRILGTGDINRKITHIIMSVWVEQVLVNPNIFPNLKYVTGATYCAQ